MRSGAGRQGGKAEGEEKIVLVEGSATPKSQLSRQGKSSKKQPGTSKGNVKLAAGSPEESLDNRCNSCHNQLSCSGNLTTSIGLHKGEEADWRIYLQLMVCSASLT